jgi:hypothetical protein
MPRSGGPNQRAGPSEEPSRLIDRRRFLQGAVAGLGAIALSGGAAGAATGRHRLPARPRRADLVVSDVSPRTLPGGLTAPSARWVVEENARPGTNNWVVTGIQTPHALEGYASQVSAVAGDDVALFVNTTAPAFHVEAYRMGYYQGLAGRLIYQSDTVGRQTQPSPSITPGTNMVSANWEPSLTLAIDHTWPPGNYLLKLVGTDGEQQYIPLTIRDDASVAAFVIQNSVTTWQAYNLWGDYSLYYGTAPGGKDFANRARVVSFDRPYPQTWAQGAADFFGNEFPLLFEMERLGLDLTYWTDVDLHAQPQLLANHRVLFSLGHDEYWSTEMRSGAQSALSKGTNLAFLGANACYRQIRLQPSAVGPNRQQVCYKDAAEDPLSREDPALTTVNWIQSPLNHPESSLIGSMYQAVGANADLTVTDSSAWLWNDTGLSDGEQLIEVVQGEYDRYVPSLPNPAGVDVLAHTPVSGQGNWSDITYYTLPSGGGGVLASGAASFVFKLSNTTAFPWNIVPKAIPGVTEILLQSMHNVFGTFGNGPAGAVQPSGGNWTNFYRGGAAAIGTAPGTTSA